MRPLTLTPETPQCRDALHTLIWSGGVVWCVNCDTPQPPGAVDDDRDEFPLFAEDV